MWEIWEKIIVDKVMKKLPKVRKIANLETLRVPTSVVKLKLFMVGDLFLLSLNHHFVNSFIDPSSSSSVSSGERVANFARKTWQMFFLPGPNVINKL